MNTPESCTTKTAQLTQDIITLSGLTELLTVTTLSSHMIVVVKSVSQPRFSHKRGGVYNIHRLGHIYDSRATYFYYVEKTLKITQM